MLVVKCLYLLNEKSFILACFIPKNVIPIFFFHIFLDKMKTILLNVVLVSYLLLCIFILCIF